MRLDPVRTTLPTEPAVSTTEAKAHIRAETADEDTLIESLVAAAVAHLDGYTGILGRAIVTQTWREDMGDFSGSRIALRVGDVQSISSITYYDIDGDQQTFAAANYRLQAACGLSYVELISTASWPSVADRDDAISITYVSGFGLAAAVPAPIKQAILLMVGHWYENREEVVVGTIASQMPLAAQSLVAPYRRIAL